MAVYLESGRFKCFSCEAWGYIKSPAQYGRQESFGVTHPRNAEDRTQQIRGDLPEVLKGYQHALPGSLGEKYILSRGIPLPLAQRYGWGYAACGKWIHHARDWKYGRIVVPHTDPSGQIVNLYGRALGPNESVPREVRHDHLPGGKGFFNAAVLQSSQPVWVTEGPFDALSLIAAGQEFVTAIFGACGWRWDWAREVKKLVLALDADHTGQNKWREIARHSRLRGIEVAFLPPEAYGGCKDINEAWVAGTLNLDA